MKLLSIDPGNTESAWVLYDTDFGYPLQCAKQNNADVLDMIRMTVHAPEHPDDLVIEQVAAMGMAVGAEVFETVFWSGRFCEAWGHDFNRVKRHQVKMHLCGNMRAKDPNIRQALLDRYGGRALAIGSKAHPGPLYRIKNDMWSALAVAVTFADTKLLASSPADGDGREASK